MKNRPIKTLSLLFMLLCAMTFVACSSHEDESNGGGSYEGVIKKYNDNITYSLSYTSDEESSDGNISNDKLHASIDFETGKAYYMVVDFTVSSFNVDGWDSSFSSSVKISPAAAVSATLEEAPTGNFTEKTEGYATNITTSYGIPESRDTAKNYRIILQFKPTEKDLINFAFSFYGDAEQADKIVTVHESFGIGVTVGLEYALNNDEKSYSVAGIGSVSGGNVVIPTFYHGLPITAIGNGAFKDCVGLNTVTIRDNVTEIDRFAFYGCSGIASITIPNSVTSIGLGAFENCSGLTDVTLPFVGATKDGNAQAYFGYVFGAQMNSFNASFVPQSLETVVITDGTKIAESAFSNCGGIKSITLPADVTLIEGKAFENCSSLVNVNIPENVTEIGYYAFSGCSSITSIIIPDSVTSMGESVFGDCSSLINVTMPADITYISISMFSGCSSLTSITIPNGVTRLGDSAFDGCSRLTSIIIPDGVTEIGFYAFAGCSSLTEITIPSGVSYIGPRAFNDCSNLNSVTFKNTSGWNVLDWNNTSNTANLSDGELTDFANAAKLLKSTYWNCFWRRS